VPERLFVDTLYIVGLVNPRDPYHEDVLAFAEKSVGIQFWTTDWVLLEAADACSRSPRLRQWHSTSDTPTRSGAITKALTGDRHFAQAGFDPVFAH